MELYDKKATDAGKMTLNSKESSLMKISLVKKQKLLLLRNSLELVLNVRMVM